MKRIILVALVLLLNLTCIAQKKSSFPYKGGKDALTSFFRDSLVISQDIIQKKLTGVVIAKFSADEKGVISKIVFYYADDALLVSPVIDALKKTNTKWAIPDDEKTHDYVIAFSYRFNLPVTNKKGAAQALLNNYGARRPLNTNNQIPLDMATLLPTIGLHYDVTQ